MTLVEVDQVGGALSGEGAIGIGLGVVAIGLGIAAAPIGIFGAVVAGALSMGGGMMTGYGISMEMHWPTMAD